MPGWTYGMNGWNEDTEFSLFIPQLVCIYNTSSVWSLRCIQIKRWVEALQFIASKSYDKRSTEVMWFERKTIRGWGQIY